MAASGSIRIVKTIEWKGGTQEWSNRYHFDGTLPADSATWEILADNVVDAEAPCFPADIVIVKAVGYGPATDVPVYSKDYATAGTGAFGGEDRQAAEVVALAKYSTTKRSTKNHPVYLFNYFHGVTCHSATALDFLFTDQKTALQTYVDTWVGGFIDGTDTHRRVAPDGSGAVDATVETYVTHRDFPR